MGIARKTEKGACDIHLELTQFVLCEVIMGMAFEQNPRWMLDGKSVFIGPYHSADEHDQHISQTIGSSDWLWSANDELRFDPETLILQSASLIVPDATLPASLSLEAWQAAPQEAGLLQLTHAQNFQLEHADFRFMDRQGFALTCVCKNALESAQKRLKLHIAKNIELFFADEHLCGWALLHPALFIVDGWENPEDGNEDVQFTALLHDYLSLLTDPYIEQMEDRSAPMLDQLRDLYSRAAAQPSFKRYNILGTAIAEKIDQFYDEKPN